ncbi:MAG: glutathione S-transferase N-terminal domain-containing protein [Myxococcota bacterium]
MTRDELRAAVAARLQKAHEAHHEAFAAAKGEDPDWAIWYATNLREELSALLGVELVLQELVVCLAHADAEHQARAADAPWPPFYARLLVDRYVPAKEEMLALYYYPSCPFCRRVTRVIDELDIDVELRDIWQDPQHRADLQEARGRTTVPVLRCQSGDVDRWMPESLDIIAYLRQRFAA